MLRRTFLGSVGAALLGIRVEGQKHNEPAQGADFDADALPNRPVGNAPLVRLSTPRDAARVALHDLPNCSLFERYVWVQSGEDHDFQALSFALNQVSRGAYVFLQEQVDGILARVDLRLMAATDQDLVDLLNLWEELAFDWHFTQLITGDTLELLAEQVPTIQVLSHVPQWSVPSKGKPKRLLGIGKKWRKVATNDTVVVRQNTPICNDEYTQLQVALGTLAPIVDSRYLTARILSSIKDEDLVRGWKQQNLFSTVWGGRYYEWAGIRKSQVEGRTDLQQLMIDIGVGSKDETFDQFFDRLRSDCRASMYRSDVTGKPRRVVYIGTPTARLPTANGVIWITNDIRNRDVDRGADATANIVDSKVAAFEVIWTRRNGTLGYALYGAKQELLEKGADDVVSDSTVPPPHTAELQSSISCLRCHGPYDGLQPLRNELTSQRVLGDVGRKSRDVSFFDTIDRITGWYKDEATDPLFIARMQFARTTFKSTGRWKGVANEKVVPVASARIAQVFAEERYNAVDAGVALRWLGYPVPEEGVDKDGIDKRLVAFRGALVPDARARIAEGDFLEDPTIDGLLRGKKVTPFQWALSYSFALERAWRDR